MKILLLSTLYSLPGEKILNNTNVCHSFAKEWVKLGHEVRVIYQYPIYHPFLHFVANLFEKFIANHFYGAVTTKRVMSIDRFNIDGVDIIRIPLYKAVPHILFSPKSIQQHVNRIIQENEKDGFVPNIVVGHFFYPNIKIAASLKKKYHSKAAIVVHYQGISIEKVYRDIKKNNSNLIDAIDYWGYRSKPIQDYFEKVFGSKENHFFCYSGVPSFFFNEELKPKDFSKLTKFIYVGALIERKHPLAVLEGIHKADGRDFSLAYIGVGKQQEKIQSYIKKESLQSNVTFLGHVERYKITKHLENAQVFVMISDKETFGLVYLEAMSKGCIVIASKGEGIDGIIQDGENGFLCKPGNVSELKLIIKKINAMPPEKLQEISLKAYQTALGLTDEKVAKNYLAAITKAS